MKISYLNILISILIIASLSAAIVSADHHPVHEQNNQPDKGPASASLVSVDYHRDDNCILCHNHGGELSNLNSISEKTKTPNNGRKKNNQQDMSVASVSLTSTEYHHVDHCVVCHDMSGKTSNLYLVFEVINTPNSGPKDVIFTAYEGTNSYADGDITYDGVCEVCHTDTRHHRNDGNNTDPDSHYANTSCRECHAHADEFSHGGPCEVCHGHDPGYEYEPDKFSEGAGTIQSHSTHTENDSDDLKGPYITCDDCHDTDNYPYFKSGTGEAPYDLSETDVCDNCHSAGGSINGIYDVAVGAKENWNYGIYESEGATLQPGKDKWCAGCHDDEPAIIVVPAPNIVGQSVLAGDGNWQTPGTIVEDNGIVGGNTTMPDAEILIDGNLSTGISAGKIGNVVVFDLGESVDVSHIRLHTVNNTETVFPPTVHWLVYGSNDLEGEWTRVLLGQSVMFARPSWLTGVEDGWDESRLDKIIPVRYIKLEKGNIWPCGVNTQMEFQYKVDLQYGYYETGHKIDCDNCHDISSAHFDGISQTYNASLDNYQAGYRLRNVTVNGESVYPMEIPRLGLDRRFYETNNDFALCFDCHDKFKLFGYANGTGEFFKDPLETNFYNNDKLDGGGNPVNQHRVHIQGLGWCGNISTWDSDWDSTADDWNMSYDSRMSCTACHNVHGSPTLAMTRHGELISTPGTMDKVPLLNVKYINADGTLDSGNGSYNILETFGAQTQFYLPGQGNPGKNNMCLMCHNELLIYHRDPVVQVPSAPVPPNTIPPVPTSLDNTTGNDWVNFTWAPGAGIVTDGYNVSMNDDWYNTTNTYLNSSVGAGNWSNITVWAWNTTGAGNMSATNVSDNVQVPAPISALTCDCGDICVNTSGWWRDNGTLNTSGTQIQAAIDNATAGETIYVYNGSYTENVNINKRLTLEGEGADVVTVTNSTANNHVFEVTADYVNISGFNVTGATGSFKAGIYLNSREHCNISGNNASGNYYGIYMLSSSNNTLTGNTANLNTQHGIYLRGSSDNTLMNNTAHSNTLHGIWLWLSSNDNVFTNNNVSGNGQHGIYLQSLCNNNTLTNNTASDNTQQGIYMLSSSNCTLTNNTASNNTNQGIFLRGSSDNILTNNTALDNSQHGIYLWLSSNDNTLTNNTANSNNYGIWLNSLCNNNTLTNNTASNNTNQGIYLQSSSNNTLTSNTANSNNHGIFLRGSSDNILTNNTALDNSQHGIYLWLSSNDNTLTNNTANSNNYGIWLNSLCNNNTLTNNTASNNTNQGIYLQSSSNNTLTSNTANSNNHGIFLRGSSDNILTNNTALDNSQHGIYLWLSSNDNTLTNNTANSNNYGIWLNSLCNNNTFTNNTASNNTNQGIYLQSSSNNTLTSNTANSNNHGIFLRGSSDNILTNNTALDNSQHGIYLWLSSNDNTLTNNTANSNNYGIWLNSLCNNNTLTNNTASNNTNQGIYLQSSSNNTLMSNTANSNNHGIYLRGSNNCTLTNNTANSNNYGIYLWLLSNNNTITNNTADLNNYGIQLVTTCNNNTIYNNYFNNTNNAYDTGYNTWNTTRTTGTNIIGGSWLGGNYWSDYAGADTTSDDLGDTLLPYNSSGNIQNGGDYHPTVTMLA